MTDEEQGSVEAVITHDVPFDRLVVPPPGPAGHPVVDPGDASPTGRTPDGYVSINRPTETLVPSP